MSTLPSSPASDIDLVAAVLELDEIGRDELLVGLSVEDFRFSRPSASEGGLFGAPAVRGESVVVPAGSEVILRECCDADFRAYVVRDECVFAATLYRCDVEPA